LSIGVRTLGVRIKVDYYSIISDQSGLGVICERTFVIGIWSILPFEKKRPLQLKTNVSAEPWKELISGYQTYQIHIWNWQARVLAL
jgi:hypothetical protein